MKAMHLVMLLFVGLTLLSRPLWAAESAPPLPPPPSESATPPKDHKKSESPKREAVADTPPAAAPSQKSAKDAKTDAPPAAAKNKAETKGEATKEGAKKEAAPGDKPAQAEPEPQSPPPQKVDVAPPKRPVGSVMLSIKLALMADPLLFPYEIEVEMDGEKAVLSGRVATEDDKRSAAEIAQGVETVKGVVNKLEVVKELGATLIKRQDHAILQYVKERFARSETLKAAGFDVKCEQGVIFLSGKTRFQVFALEAAQAARQVPGVRAVDTTHVQVSGESKE